MWRARETAFANNSVFCKTDFIIIWSQFNKEKCFDKLYSTYAVETSEQKRTNASEWSPGTSKLQIMNDILTLQVLLCSK